MKDQSRAADTFAGSPDTATRDGDIDVRQLLATIIEGRWIIAASVAVSMLGASIYLAMAQPIYRADALIQVEPERSGFASAFSQVAEMFGQKTPEMAGEMGLVRSRMVIGRVVDDRNLTIRVQPRYFPFIGRAVARRHSGNEPAEPLAGLDGYAWGGERIRVSRLQLPEAYRGKRLQLVAGDEGRYELFDPDGNLLLAGQVGIEARARFGDDELILHVEELRARPATRFELSLRSRLAAIAELQGRLRISEKGERSNLMEIALEDTDRVRAATLVNAVADQYVRQNIERKSAEAAQRLAFLDEQLPVVKAELQAAEEALTLYRNHEGSVDLDKQASALLQQLVAVDQELTDLRQKREELIRRFTAAHPAVVALDAQISRLHERAAELEVRVGTLPKTQQEILRLTRNVEVSTALYTNLLNSYQQLQVIKAGTIGNVRVIDRAAVPLGPVKPMRKRVMLTAVLLGGAAGIGIVFLRRLFRTGVSDPEVLEQRLGLPVYSTVLHSRGQDKLGAAMRKGESRESYLLAVARPQDVAVESLRSLRTALHFATLGASNNLLMITGPVPEVGKSFISVNLAAVLAMSEKRVLIIDADMRRGRLHQYLRVEREHGLSEVLSGALPLDQAIRRTEVERMDAITAGAVAPSSAELLMQERFGRLLQEVGERYDFVLIDTPPALLLADAGIIGRYAGATLLVLQAERHSLREIEHTVKRLQQAGANLRGLLMNDVRLTASAYGYGYGYGYGYRYGYGYGYGDK